MRLRLVSVGTSMQFKLAPREARGKEWREEMQDVAGGFHTSRHIGFAFCSALCSSGSAYDLCMLMCDNQDQTRHCRVCRRKSFDSVF